MNLENIEIYRKTSPWPPSKGESWEQPLQRGNHLDSPFKAVEP